MKRTRIAFHLALGAWALLGTGTGAFHAQAVSPETLEAVTAALPQEATCRLTGCTFRFGGTAKRPGMIAFQGEAHNRSLAPVEVLIQVGFKEGYNARQNRDLWFVKNTRATTLEPGGEGFSYRISVPGPPSLNQSMERGFLVPLAELREAATGFLLDATVPASFAQGPPIPQFDPMALAEDHLEKVAGYEIVWQAALPQPDGVGRARFSGIIRNLEAKSETVLLQAGFVNVLARHGQDKGWSWKAEKEISLSASQKEVPFELEVSCPSGIYVGIAGKVYEGHATLLTEQQREAIRRAEERSRQPREIAPERILFDPKVKGFEIGNARYAYTLPGKAGNAGRFEFTLTNRSEQPQALLLRCGFLRIQPPAPWNPRTWHFIGEESVELKAGEQINVVKEVRCHIAMENRIDAGEYDAFILVAPGN